MMAAKMKRISLSTPILAIGHLPGHVTRKVELLLEAGFTKPEGIIMANSPMPEIKAKLAATPDGLFLVGGAMMHGYPGEMKEMLDFIATTVPTLQVYTISKTDFPEDLVFPPTEEQVAFYSLQACKRLLSEE